MTESAIEGVEQFRVRARAWIEANLEPRDGEAPPRIDVQAWAHSPQLQRASMLRNR